MRGDARSLGGRVRGAPRPRALRARSRAARGSSRRRLVDVSRRRGDRGAPEGICWLCRGGQGASSSLLGLVSLLGPRLQGRGRCGKAAGCGGRSVISPPSPSASSTGYLCVRARWSWRSGPARSTTRWPPPSGVIALGQAVGSTDLVALGNRVQRARADRTRSHRRGSRRPRRGDVLGDRGRAEPALHRLDLLSRPRCMLGAHRPAPRRRVDGRSAALVRGPAQRRGPFRGLCRIHRVEIATLRGDVG